MRELVIDTSRCASAKKDVWETSALTPYSSTSTMSAALPPDGSSNVGSDSLTPPSDVKVKLESIPSPSPESLPDANSPTVSTGRRKLPGPRERSPGEEPKKHRVNERSKTGCLTCRKRKKKCDENRPSCNNCLKTNYTCAGYPPQRQWNTTPTRSPRHKPEDETRSARAFVLPPQQSLLTFPAIENEDDDVLLDHYIQKMSKILTIHNVEESNPWTDLILPMAKDDQALMHFVLALAGSHLARTRNSQRLNDRQMFHVGAAISALRQRLDEIEPLSPNTESVMASMIFQFLLSKNDYKMSAQATLQVARGFLKPPETPFWRFAWSFCTYHEFSTTFTSLPGPHPRPSFAIDEDAALTPGASDTDNGHMQQNFHILVGVVDMRLMTIISQIAVLRDQVRKRQELGLVPHVHSSMFATANELGREITTWKSGKDKDSARYVAAELYRKASMLYLLRTVRAASSPDSRKDFATCVEQGLECLGLLPAGDPVQSGLLLPTFILGCGAFEPQYRDQLERALDTIEQFSNFGNVKQVRHILRRVWNKMDAGDVESSWDWETLTQEMGYLSLVT